MVNLWDSYSINNNINNNEKVKVMSRANAIKLLLTKGYDIYIPLTIANVLVIDVNNSLKKCIVRAAYKPTNGNIIVSISQRTGGDRRFVDESSADYILCINDKTLWLLPMEDVAAFTSIRLGDKYASYILNDVNVTVNVNKTAKEEDDVLRDAAIAAAGKY